MKKSKLSVRNLEVVVTGILTNFLFRAFGEAIELYHFEMVVEPEPPTRQEQKLEVSGVMAVIFPNKKRHPIRFKVLVTRDKKMSPWRLIQFLSISYSTGKGWKEINMRVPNVGEVRDMKRHFRLPVGN